ncbi:hypothetical protein [Streptomyces virginiae]|uniref:hypothetical protein n=1 Tax=Streptomyces virginiae TaxID=1961 RepID=UPI0036A44515
MGRCVPGPPAPDLVTVSPGEGDVHVYRLRTVGSWSAPNDPIAVYDPEGPPVPPLLLTDQEQEWLREGQRRRGLGPIRLVALVHGRMERDPDAATIEAMLAGLRKREHLLLQRLTDPDEGDSYIHVLLDQDDTYEVEHRADTAAGRDRTRSASLAAVRDAVLRWATDRPSRRTALEGPEPGDGR